MNFRMMALAVVAAFPFTIHAQQTTLFGLPMFSVDLTSSPAEAVELTIALGDPPGAEISRLFRFQLDMISDNANGTSIGKFRMDAALTGVAKVRFTVVESSSGPAELFANDVKVGDIMLKNGRASFQIDLRRSNTASNPMTGEQVPIPPSVGGGVTVAILDTSTGATRGSDWYILRPVVRADGYENDAVLWEMNIGPLSQSTDEAVNLQIAVGDNPGASIGQGNIKVAFLYDARVVSPSGALLGVVTQEVPMDGFSEVQFTTRPMLTMEGDEVGLFADDDFIGMLNVENGRVSYRLDVGWAKMGRDRATGEQVPMPPNFGVNFTATTINGDGQAVGHTRGQWQNRDHFGDLF